MTGEKGDTTGVAVPARSGYRISRIEEPATGNARGNDTRSAARDSLMTSSDKAATYSSVNGYKDADDTQDRGRAGSGANTGKAGGGKKKGKRGGRGGKGSGAAAAAANDRSGGLDRGVPSSTAPPQQQQQKQQQQQHKQQQTQQQQQQQQQHQQQKQQQQQQQKQQLQQQHKQQRKQQQQQQQPQPQPQRSPRPQQETSKRGNEGMHQSASSAARDPSFPSSSGNPSSYSSNQNQKANTNARTVRSSSSNRDQNANNSTKTTTATATAAAAAVSNRDQKANNTIKTAATATATTAVAVPGGTTTVHGNNKNSAENAFLNSTAVSGSGSGRYGNVAGTVGSPPPSPRNSLHRGSDQREHRRQGGGRGFSDDVRGPGRHAVRALREAVSPLPARQQQQGQQRQGQQRQQQQQQQQQEGEGKEQRPSGPRGRGASKSGSAASPSLFSSRAAAVSSERHTERGDGGGGSGGVDSERHAGRGGGSVASQRHTDRGGGGGVGSERHSNRGGGGDGGSGGRHATGGRHGRWFSSAAPEAPPRARADPIVGAAAATAAATAVTAAATVSTAPTAASASATAVRASGTGGASGSGVRDAAVGNAKQEQRRQQRQQQLQQKQPQQQQPPPQPQPQPQQQQHQQQQQHARGMCMSMCPAEERRQREEEGGLSAFEATDATASLPFRERVADPNRAVKIYRRSAAGRDMCSPEQLRPLSVLQATTSYLVKEVFAKACIGDAVSQRNVAPARIGTIARIVRGGGGGGGRGGGNVRVSGSSNIAKAYAFVGDRLRAVRQDLTVQGLALAGGAAAVGAAEVLETSANFYVVAGYLMSDEPPEVFDRHLHNRELQGVFSSLSEMFFQVKGTARPREVCVIPGVDEYLCLQAVHALASAVSSISRSDEQLGETAVGQGVGRVFAATFSKLCDSSPQPPSVHQNASSQATGNPLPPSPPAAAAAAAAAGCSNNGVSSETAEYVGGGKGVPRPFKEAYPKVATAVRLLEAVRSGDWSGFHRVLGQSPADIGTEGTGAGGSILLVGDEAVDSPFATRLRCVCHRMLLPVRMHALRALNKSYMKREKVPLAHVTRVLRVRSDSHAADLCRALSLPVESETVTFNAVPAAWNSEQARSCASTGFTREDDWVGLERLLRLEVDGDGGGVKPAEEEAFKNKKKACDACAGFGCAWCEGDNAWGAGGGEEQNKEKTKKKQDALLWEAVFCPPEVVG